MTEKTIQYNGGVLRTKVTREGYNDPFEIRVTVEPDDGQAVEFQLDEETCDEFIEGLYPGGWRSIWQRAIQGTYKWLDVLEDWAGGIPQTAQRFFIDADHSSLLFWIFSGNEPLPEPPPVHMSRPWHRLVTEGEGKPFSVHYHEAGMFGDEETLNVAQNTWKVLETLGENEWIATYYYKHPEDGYIPHDSRWRVWADGWNDRMDQPDWTITRIDENEDNL